MSDNLSREAQDIEYLLPWYEKGTLTDAETARVEAFLQTHPELRARLDLIREELAETVVANESIGVPGPAARDRLFDAIAAEPPRRRIRGADLSWWRRLVPEAVPPRFALAVAAAVLIILLQAAALIAFTVNGSDGDYRVAAGGDSGTAGAGSFVLVRFAEDAKAGDITALIQSLGAVVVDGPKPGGVFKLRISPKTLSDDERAATIRKLREKSDIITFAAPAG